MKFSPELKAFRYYKKNLDYYLERFGCLNILDDYEGLKDIYKEIATKFDADYEKLMDICSISYERYTERVFR